MLFVQDIFNYTYIVYWHNFYSPLNRWFCSDDSGFIVSWALICRCNACSCGASRRVLSAPLETCGTPGGPAKYTNNITILNSNFEILNKIAALICHGHTTSEKSRYLMQKRPSLLCKTCRIDDVHLMKCKSNGIGK